VRWRRGAADRFLHALIHSSSCNVRSAKFISRIVHRSPSRVARTASKVTYVAWEESICCGDDNVPRT
jgi:hypothetical protein